MIAHYKPAKTCTNNVWRHNHYNVSPLQSAAWHLFRYKMIIYHYYDMIANIYTEMSCSWLCVTIALHVYENAESPETTDRIRLLIKCLEDSYMYIHYCLLRKEDDEPKLKYSEGGGPCVPVYTTVCHAGIRVWFTALGMQVSKKAFKFQRKRSSFKASVQVSKKAFRF